MLFDPIHEFPRTTSFCHNVLDFDIEKHMFGLLDDISEFSPVFNILETL